MNIIFYYDKYTRYSINALIASIDKLEGTKIYLARDIEELLDLSRYLRSRYNSEKCIVAFSLLTTRLVENKYYLTLLGTLKELKKQKHIIVAGGPHASGDPLGTLRYLGFDYVFIGEAEKTFRDFVISIRDNEDPSRVRGVGYIEEDRFHFSGKERFINLDQYDPFPYWRGIFNPIEITRGCPYGCFYCQVSYMHGFTYRHRSIDKIVFYAQLLLRSGIRDLRFISPNSLAYGISTGREGLRLDLLDDLLSKINDIVMRFNGRIFIGSFPSEVRPEYVTSEAVRLLKKYIANKSIIIGAQSGSEGILKKINRKHSVEDVLNAVDMLAEHYITPEVDLIIGFPEESYEDMLETVKLAREVTRRGGRVHLHHYLPLPGSPFGMKPPSRVPREIIKELSRLVGAGKGYGSWLKQEEIAWKIIDLHKNNIIAPRSVGPKRPDTSP